MPDASSPMVPYGANQTIYVVEDRISRTRELRIERIDFETTIDDLMAGCFSDPLRVTCFNTLEHWVKDISAETVVEIQSRCDIEGTDLPDHLTDFVERHICSVRHTAASREPGWQTGSPSELSAR